MYSPFFGFPEAMAVVPQAAIIAATVKIFIVDSGRGKMDMCSMGAIGKHIAFGFAIAAWYLVAVVEE